MNSVTVAQAKAHLSEILDDVVRGKVVTITRRGKPVATIQPMDQPKKPIDMARIDAVRGQIPKARTPAVDLIRAIRAERG